MTDTYEVVFVLNIDNEHVDRAQLSATGASAERPGGEDTQLMLALNLLLQGRVRRVAVHAATDPCDALNARLPGALHSAARFGERVARDSPRPREARLSAAQR